MYTIFIQEAGEELQKEVNSPNGLKDDGISSNL
jgi:hypothetical protein